MEETAVEGLVSLLKQPLQYAQPRPPVVWLSMSCGKLIQEEAVFKSHPVASDFLLQQPKAQNAKWILQEQESAAWEGGIQRCKYFILQSRSCYRAIN